MLTILNKVMTFMWELVAINIFMLVFCASTPLFYTVLPFYVLFACSHQVLPLFTTAYTVLGPLACAFWMLVICHYPTIHKARLEGRLSTWRQDQGGLGHTLPKSFGFMFLGVFGAAISEYVTVKVLTNILIAGQVEGIGRIIAFFVVMPFAIFAPVLLTLLLRFLRKQNHQQKQATATAAAFPGVDLWGIDPAHYAAQYAIDERRKAEQAQDAQFLRQAGVQA